MVVDLLGNLFDVQKMGTCHFDVQDSFFHAKDGKIIRKDATKIIIDYL